MSGLSQEEVKRIIKALEDKGAKLPCPRCGNNSFTVLDGYFNQTVQTQVSGLVIGGKSVPTAVVVCNKCGFLAQHALTVLGAIPQKEEGKTKIV